MVQYVKCVIPTGQNQRQGTVITLSSNAIKIKSYSVNKGHSHHVAISVQQNESPTLKNVIISTYKRCTKCTTILALHTVGKTLLFCYYCMNKCCK